MSIYRIFRRYIRGASTVAPNITVKLSSEINAEQRILHKCMSNVSIKTDKRKSWYSFVRQWELTLPVGVGVSLLAILQWRHLRKHPYKTNEEDSVSKPVNDFVVTCYCCLPLRLTSRIWGWIASLEIPVSLRPTLYKFYAKTFKANLDEIDIDLTVFPSLVEFFVRPLRNNVRPIAHNVDIVSPSDGTVLHFGPVTSCCVEQVKGVTYNLKHFLGNLTEETMKLTDNEYVKTLLKNPANQLYQIVIYLAPGDYHRFHSPTDWQIDLRKHFKGKLLSVNPKIAGFLPDLFSLNERVVYIGEWINGFMAYAAIGATNVGSIRVYLDKNLVTNAVKWPLSKYWDDQKLNLTRITKGDLFGEFRMGSTVVLLFEAPKDFKFCLKSGQKIKVGQPLMECNTNI